MFLRFNLRNSSLFKCLSLSKNIQYELLSYVYKVILVKRWQVFFTIHNSFISSQHEYTIHIYTRAHTKTIHIPLCSHYKPQTPTYAIVAPFQNTNTTISTWNSDPKYLPVNNDLVLRCIGIHNVLFWLVLLI